MVSRYLFRCGMVYRMRREINNYIFIFLGFLILFLIYLIHFLELIKNIVLDYNNLVDWISRKTGEIVEKKDLYFMADNNANLYLLIDLCFVLIIIIIILMIYLKIKESVNYGNSK